MAQNDKNVAKAPVGRTRRSPLTNKGKLSVARKDPDFEYRIVNDDGDNVADRIAQGYVLVERSETDVGTPRVDAASAEGTPIQLSVGQGKKAFLMKIPKEYYEEDQAIKQDAVDKTEAATKAEALSGTYGKIEITRK
jgi:hypothetical protein